MMRRIILEPGQPLDQKLLKRTATMDPEVMATASKIVTDVQQRGDEALREYAQKFDGVSSDEFLVSSEAIQKAVKSTDKGVLQALEEAGKSIYDFHRRQVQQSWFNVRPDGALVGSKVTPIESVGIYVPGGRAQYPSTVLMNALPARVAGVTRIAMVTPPSADGSVDPITLAAAHLAGVTEIYAVGGAQAIAALAYGTQSIERVSKITGPGNAYVAAAKRIVSGDVGIDMIAGPSEVLILADETSQPALIAIDLMAQAEHDPKASCYLVTTDETLVEEVFEELETFLAQSPRAVITRQSLEDNGLVIVCPSLASALGTANAIAPEHLEVHMDQPNDLLGLIENAGAIFLGPWTPESVGDYVAGPNHTLPTGGTARFSSPLSVDDFVKKTSVISYSFSALENDADTITTIAEREGLWAHARAVTYRREMVSSYGGAAGSDEDGEA